jgi:hypothetical protein
MAYSLKHIPHPGKSKAAKKAEQSKGGATISFAAALLKSG